MNFGYRSSMWYSPQKSVIPIHRHTICFNFRAHQTHSSWDLWQQFFLNVLPQQIPSWQKGRCRKSYPWLWEWQEGESNIENLGSQPRTIRSHVTHVCGTIYNTDFPLLPKNSPIRICSSLAPSTLRLSPCGSLKSEDREAKRRPKAAQLNPDKRWMRGACAPLLQDPLPRRFQSW